MLMSGLDLERLVLAAGPVGLMQVGWLGRRVQAAAQGEGRARVGHRDCSCPLCNRLPPPWLPLQAALDAVLPCAQEGTMFGQGSGAKLADIYTAVQASRAYIHSVGLAVDAGGQRLARRHRRSGCVQAMLPRIPLARLTPAPPSCTAGHISCADCAALMLFGAEKATQVALSAMQLLGGNRCAVCRAAAGAAAIELLLAVPTAAVT